MGLLKKKCEYCKAKIDKGSEVFKNVKIPEFVGTRPKAFCCSEHAESYQREILEKPKKAVGGSCCG